MPNSPFDIASQSLLEPENLSTHDLELVLGRAMSAQVDYADVYLQSVVSESWVLEDSLVKDSSYDVSRGASVRVISDEKTGFAYSDDILLPSLESAATAAKSIAIHAQTPVTPKIVSRAPGELYQPDNPILSWDQAQKIALLHAIETQAKAADPRVSQVIASLAASYQTIMILASDGTFAVDVRPMVRVNINIIAESNGRREQGSAGGGGRFDFNTLASNDFVSKQTEKAVKQALLNLEAEPAPAGTMPVVLGPGWPGVLLHEAIGHGLEGDFNRKKSSMYSGKMGEQVASSLCTIVDDGTLAGRRGSLNIDDEGTPSHCTTLIENGILKGYMQDKFNARLMGGKSTGNGRRESYAHSTLPRMTNTYMLPGESDPEEIIRSVKKGIYAVNFAGGQVDITSGQFVFSANEAYLIEDGKITTPIKGATLIGNGPDALRKVSMVGNDLQLDDGVGVCGKDGQSVPVGVGQPTLKIDEMTVGGTAKS
jgi:TldD protein